MGLDLRAILSLDGSGFEAGVRRADRLAAGLSGTLNSSLKGAIAGAFSVGAVTMLTKKTVEYAGHLNDLSDRLGVSTKFLQEFQYIAKQTGTDVDALTTFIEKLNSARIKALSGKGGEGELGNFRRLGVSEQDLKSMGTEDLIMKKIAVAFEHGNTEQLSAAMRGLGIKGAGAMIPAFEAGFRAMAKKANEAGQVMSEDVIQQLDDIGDQFAILGNRLMVEWGNTIIKMIGWVGKLKNVVTEQLPAFLGAGTANWKGKDFGKLGLDLLFPWLFLFPKTRPPKFDTEAGGQAADDAEKKYKAELEADAKAREKLREDRKKRQQTPPGGFTAPDVRKAAPEDSLIKVGNFLGSSSNTLAAIGEQTNSLLQTISRQMGTLISNTSNTGSIFPPS